MKLNIDLGYILKRIIVIVLAFVIIQSIKGCDVFAENFNVSQTSCNMYYGSANSNRTGTLGTAALGGNTNVFTCNNSTSDYYGKTAYINRISITTGYYNLSFMVADNYEISNVAWRSDAKNTYCEMNTGILVPVTSGSVQTYYVYTVNCYNVYLVNNQNNQIILTSATNNASRGYGIRVSTNINISKVQDISSSIDNQTHQQHQDAQDTQNAINNVDDSLNDSSIDTNTQNANGLFDTDSNGQITNSNFQNFGIEGVITAPLAILQRTTEQCSPVSFTIFGKSITLPCGDTLFWNRDFSSQSSIFNSGVSGTGLNTTRNTFRDFWNLFFGGAIIFHLLLKLYEVIQNAVDPVKDDWNTLSSAIDTGKVVRDEDEYRDSVKVKVSALDAGNVESYLHLKGV